MISPQRCNFQTGGLAYDKRKIIDQERRNRKFIFVDPKIWRLGT